MLERAAERVGVDCCDADGILVRIVWDDVFRADPERCSAGEPGLCARRHGVDRPPRPRGPHGRLVGVRATGLDLRGMEDRCATWLSVLV